MNNPNFNEDFNQDQDRDLVRFIKQNQPIAPPASSNLQLSIMKQVSTMGITRPEINHKKLGILGATIIATLGLVIFNQSRPLQTALNENDSLKTEKSLVSNWSIAGEEFTTNYSLLSSANYSNY
ncbi:hypothetical protein Syn7502_02000 [Synechococcus sp. PCC 7502]|uniref:hypothetical protein n=1 Tax=Synechococcus sp. PCC 7502 TaxID=1173263 RepID=UPI00029FD2F7|nr:hypothetical protein [Synechococcus sp. PCC 7502]AFY74026.1 hypothetical protein Syn7502_02000 [Synechococcus sp. PCC 7502]